MLPTVGMISWETAKVVVALPLGVVLLLAGRGHLRKKLARQRRNGLAVSRALVVGCEPGVAEILRSLQDKSASGIDTVAVYTPTSPHEVPRPPSDVPEPLNLLPSGSRPSGRGKPPGR